MDAGRAGVGRRRYPARVPAMAAHAFCRPVGRIRRVDRLVDSPRPRGPGLRTLAQTCLVSLARRSSAPAAGSRFSSCSMARRIPPRHTAPGRRCHWTFIPGGLAGLFFDQQFGLIVYAPVLAAALAGAVHVRVRERPGGPVHGDGRGRALSRRRGDVLDVVGGRAGDTRTLCCRRPSRVRDSARQAPGPRRPLGRTTLATLLGVSLAFTVFVIGVDRGAFAWNVRGALGALAGMARPGRRLVARVAELFLAAVAGGSFDGDSVLRSRLRVAGGCGRIAVMAGRAAVRRISTSRGSGVDRSGVERRTWRDGAGSGGLVAEWRAGSESGPVSDRASRSTARRAERGPVASFSSAVWPILKGCCASGPVTRRGPEPRCGAPFGDCPRGPMKFVSRRRGLARATSRYGLGAAGRPWRTLTVLPLSRQAFVMTLPANVAELTIEPDAGLRRSAERWKSCPWRFGSTRTPRR